MNSTFSLVIYLVFAGGGQSVVRPPEYQRLSDLGCNQAAGAPAQAAVHALVYSGVRVVASCERDRR